MNLLIRFSDQSASFTNGVEFGRLLAQLEAGVAVVENHGFPVHDENRAVLQAAAQQYGYTAVFGPCIDGDHNEYPGWTAFRALKNPCLN